MVGPTTDEGGTLGAPAQCHALTNDHGKLLEALMVTMAQNELNKKIERYSYLSLFTTIKP
jgi:hypothetical protein